jgi:hypothetical protein
MKKIRLNVADLDATEILSRDQLKAIFGGSTGSSGTCGVNINCGSERVREQRDMSKATAQNEAAAFNQNPDALASACKDHVGSAKAYWCCESC